MKWYDYLTVILLITPVFAVWYTIQTGNATASDGGVGLQMLGFLMLLREFVNFGYSEDHPKFNDSWFNRHNRKIAIIFIIFGLFFTTSLFPLNLHL